MGPEVQGQVCQLSLVVLRKCHQLLLMGRIPLRLDSRMGRLAGLQLLDRGLQCYSSMVYGI
jgi:hypothetical protein